MRLARAATLVLAAGALMGQESAPPSGDVTRGQTIFEGKGGCLGCHRVLDKGSHFGPDLTDIGERAGSSSSLRARMRRRRSGGGADSEPARSPEAELEQSLIDPGAEILPANRTVRLVTREGEAITARVLNQDTFTLLLIDTRERVLSISKSDLREFAYIKESPMPSYRDKLSRQELADVIAYLLSLKGIDE